MGRKKGGLDQAEGGVNGGGGQGRARGAFKQGG